MGKRIAVDLWIVCICAAMAGIAWIYMDEGRERIWVLAGGAAIALFFALLAFSERKAREKRLLQGSMEEQIPLEDMDNISELALLSEEDTELMVWDMYGKVSLVIGRDVGENQVDVDLSQSSYPGMVDVEHAVLNFSNGNWYIEDVGSNNGISIHKGQANRLYKISADSPCRVESGEKGRASAELENSICPYSTSENLRTQGGREFSAKEKKNRCWKGKCGTGIGGYKRWVTGI